MKSRVSRIEVLSFLFICLVFLTALSSGLPGMRAEGQNILQRQRAAVATPSVTSVTPQKAILIQSGEAVVVEAKGTNLPMIGSVQVTRAGNPAPGIEATLDQSQLPTVLKVSLKASSKAQVASDYLLTVFNASQKKLFDVPNSVLAIEVQAPSQRILSTKKPAAATMVPPTTQAAEKQAAQPTKPVSAVELKPSLESAKTSSKVEGFLKSVQAARSLAEVRAAIPNANFSQVELDQIKKQIDSSPALRQKIETFVNQRRAEFKKEGEMLKNRVDAKAAALAAKRVPEINKSLRKESQFKQKTAVLAKFGDRRSCESDVPVVTGIEANIPEQSIQPGQEFGIRGKGLGTGPGAVDLMTQGHIFPVHITEWTNCIVWARLDPDEVVGVRADPAAIISLRTNTGRETRYETKFQPTLVCITGFPPFRFGQPIQPGNYDWALNAGGSLEPDTGDYLLAFFAMWSGCTGNSGDWTVTDFTLKNDYCIEQIVFDSASDSGDPGDAHAEITASPPLHTPNCSARTNVHAGTKLCYKIYWGLNLWVIGPKGLPFK
jgi:hypothetical protein